MAQNNSSGFPNTLSTREYLLKKMKDELCLISIYLGGDGYVELKFLYKLLNQHGIHEVFETTCAVPDCGTRFKVYLTYLNGVPAYRDLKHLFRHLDARHPPTPDEKLRMKRGENTSCFSQMAWQCCEAIRAKEKK